MGRGQASRENGKKGGRPKGSLGPEQLDKIAMRELVRQRVGERLDELVDAQIANALGISYLVTGDKKTGKFIRVGPAMASRANEETIQVWQKDPSVPALTDLMNRAIDKPAEQPTQLEHAGKDSGPLEIIVRSRGIRKATRDRLSSTWSTLRANSSLTDLRVVGTCAQSQEWAELIRREYARLAAAGAK